MNERCCIRLSEKKPSGRTVRELSLELMNYYGNQALSYNKWDKQPPVQVDCHTTNAETGAVDRRWKSRPIHISELRKHLVDNRSFQPKAFNLFGPMTKWMDSSVRLSPKFHVSDADGTSLKFQTKLEYGDSFPIAPILDRQGKIITSMQIPLQERLMRLYKRVVDDSDKYDSDDWFYDIRTWVTDIVSLVDITLMQLYRKAQYDPLPGWIFDEDKVGHPFSRRMKDKLAWVGKITGSPLDDVPQEYKALKTLKELRNHLQHFDPPCVCYSVDDVVQWLSLMPMVARLVWKIRRRAGVVVSIPLIELLLAPMPKLELPERETRRIEQANGLGYQSCIWTDAPEGDVI